jgi:glycosyltransferase involved in cell wall biosynthesis
MLEWKPGVLLTHNLTGCGFGTPQVIQKSGVRWVHVLHDPQLFEPSGKIMHGETHERWRDVWRFAWTRLRRKALGRPDAVVSPTRWLLAQHERRGFFSRTRCEVIPNPLPAAASAHEARDDLAVIYLGRLDPDKGIDLLLDAWQNVRHVASKLVIVGRGMRSEEIKKIGDPKIEYRGQLASEEVVRLLQRCGVCVVPSLVLENQPTVILEALSAGCRVVASDVGGTAETLDAAGWIFPAGSVRGLIEALLQALQSTHDPQREHLAAQILRLHDPAFCVSRLEGLLKSNL